MTLQKFASHLSCKIWLLFTMCTHVGGSKKLGVTSALPPVADPREACPSPRVTMLNLVAGKPHGCR